MRQTLVNKHRDSRIRAVAERSTATKHERNSAAPFIDNSLESLQLLRLQSMADNSSQAANTAQLQAIADRSPQSGAQRIPQKGLSGRPVQRQEALEEELQMKTGPSLIQLEVMEEEELQLKADPGLQRRGVEEEELLQGKLEPAQKNENKTGMPDDLKAGIENLSGLSMDDVKVHFNSTEPAKLQALAYTQGTNIHVAPGQEKHLAHEAWHVAQQKQGRVKPTMEMAGTRINDDQNLEHEADVMGDKVRNSQLGNERLHAKENHHVAPAVVELKTLLSNVGTQEPEDMLNFYENVDPGFGGNLKNLEKKYGESKWLKEDDLSGMKSNDQIVFVGHGNSSTIKTWAGQKDGNAFGDLLDTKNLKASPIDIDLKSCETGNGFNQTLSNRLFHQYGLENTVGGPTTKTATTAVGEDKWLTEDANREVSKLGAAIRYAKSHEDRFDPASSNDPNIPPMPTIPDKHRSLMYGYSTSDLVTIYKELLADVNSWSKEPMTKRAKPDLMLF